MNQEPSKNSPQKVKPKSEFSKTGLLIAVLVIFFLVPVIAGIVNTGNVDDDSTTNEPQQEEVKGAVDDYDRGETQETETQETEKKTEPKKSKTIKTTETSPSPPTSTVKPKTSPPPESSYDPTVYTTNTGSKYHSAGCQYLSKSCIPIKLSAAKASGLTPCSRCSPPR